MSAATSNPQQHTPLPYAELCSIFTDLPDTPIIVSAFDYARDHMPHTIFNHVTRSWIFATKVAAARGEVFDAEVVAVSTLLHDIGLTPHGDGENRFEVNGASIAKTFVRELGFDDRRAQLVWDGIALHATQSISLFKETDVALSSRGIGVDFGTADYHSLDPADIAAVLVAVPRLNMKREFAACALHLAQTKPETTYENFIRDFGERYVPGYKAPSYVDAIAGGPFDE
jgi:hypothetical protein